MTELIVTHDDNEVNPDGPTGPTSISESGSSGGTGLISTVPIVPVAAPADLVEAGDRAIIPVYATSDQHLALMNRKHAVTKENGKTVVVEFVGEHGIEYSSPREIEQFYRNIKVTMGDGTRISLGRWWLDHEQRRQYEAIVFEPSRPDQQPSPTKTTATVGAGVHVYNRWRGFAVKPKPGDWSLYADNLLNNICRGNDEHYQYLLNWMAHAVQQPEEKPGVAVVFRSDERGTGKSTACDYFAQLFGFHGLQVASADHLTGRFNSHLEILILLVINEALWAGDKLAESILKSMITESHITTEKKYYDVKQRPSYLRVMMTANSSWVVPAGWSERRFFVLEAADRAVGAAQYWRLLRKQMREGGLEGLLHDLLQRDISRFNPRDVPVTQALIEQKIQSLDDTARWLYSCLERGTWSEKHQQWETEIGRNQIYELYLESAARLTWRKTRAMQTELGRLLSRVFPGANNGPQIRLAGSRVRYYTFPPLATAREQFARYLQAPEGADLFAHAGGDDRGIELITGLPDGHLAPVVHGNFLVGTPSDDNDDND